jgi:hypothetical protein
MQEKTMTNHPAVVALQKACKGLLFPSESEAKLEPFLWTNGNTLTQARLLDLSGSPKNTPIEEMTLDSLFRVVPKEERPPFDKLAKVLQEQLSTIKVYKLGEQPEKQVFIVGKTTDGQWAGLKTMVVET